MRKHYARVFRGVEVDHDGDATATFATNFVPAGVRQTNIQSGTDWEWQMRGGGQHKVESLRRARSPQQRRVMHIPLSAALSAELTAAIDGVLNHQGAAGAPALGKAMELLTDETISFFFVEIVARLNLGVVGRKTVDLGTTMASKAFGMIINRLINSLSPQQLVTLAAYLHETAVLEVCD